MCCFLDLYFLKSSVVYSLCRSHDSPLFFTVVLLLVIDETHLDGEVIFYCSWTAVHLFGGDRLDGDGRLAALRDLLWISKIHLFDVRESGPRCRDGVLEEDLECSDYLFHKKAKKEGRKQGFCMPILYEFQMFSQIKTIPSNSRELYLSTEYADVALDLRLKSTDDFTVGIIV